LGYTLPQDLH